MVSIVRFGSQERPINAAGLGVAEAAAEIQEQWSEAERRRRSSWRELPVEAVVVSTDGLNEGANGKSPLADV